MLLASLKRHKKFSVGGGGWFEGELVLWSNYKFCSLTWTSTKLNNTWVNSVEPGVHCYCCSSIVFCAIFLTFFQVAMFYFFPGGRFLFIDFRFRIDIKN